MQNTLIASVVAAVALGAAPAAAQVYPDRIEIKTKARAVTTATAYQRRDRDDSREQQVERTTKTFRLGQSGSLVLQNISGDITVTAANGSDTTVEIVKTARGRDAADARELLQLVTVETNERNGRAEVKTHYPNSDEIRRRSRRSVNVSVAYTVSVPAGTRLSTESISGDIRITDVKADVSANTISGDVRITGAHVGSARTISGNVEVVDAQVDGTLESSSVSGDVALRRVSAKRVDARSVSGDIKLEDIQSDRVSAQTTSANIWMSGTLAKNGRYELKGFSGDVHVVLSGKTGFELDASSFSGEIHASDFPVTIRGRIGRHSLSGTYGDGSAVLDLSTFSGSIVVSKK
jgi:DUF4097 and DUF4098 domain-containing protein YvlB